jgi:hypothetical protein
MPGARRPALALTAGLAVAVVALPLAAASGPPYLSLNALNPFLVVFAIGAFVALFAVPFLIHGRLGGRLEEDARWERALVRWGGVATAAIGIGLVVGLPSGFASDSLAGSAGLTLTVEAGLVLGTLLIWLIAG